MSIQAVAWVLTSSESRGITRLVLISLANHANHDGVCWPSQRTIAAEAGIASGTVSQAIARLVDIGEIEVVDRGGVRKSSTYRLAHLVSAVRAPGPNAVRAPEARRTIKNRQEPLGGRFRGELDQRVRCTDCGALDVDCLCP